MKEISVSSKETTASQIRVEKQLSDLTDSILEENRNEDTDTLSINIINQHLGLDIQPFDIDRMHRISNKNKEAGKKGWATITTFTRYNTRKKVFMNKKKFKGTNISVTESLTSLWMTKLKDARDEYGFNKIWTSDGRIMVIEEESAKPKVIYGWLLNQWLCCVLHYEKIHSFLGVLLNLFQGKYIGT